MTIDSIDFEVALFFNEFVQRSWTFDALMVFLGSSNLSKGYLSLPLVWWAWFAYGRDEYKRAIIGTVLVSCVLAVAISQVLQYYPLRLRPLFTPGLHLKHADGLAEVHYDKWSSIPSDHATFFFSIAVGLFLISRPLGWLALAHALLIVSFPRIYLGLHYLSDVLAGALLGGGLTFACCSSDFIRQRIGAWMKAWEQWNSAVFYTGLFLVTSQMMYLFYDAHEFALFLSDLIKGLVSQMF